MQKFAQYKTNGSLWRAGHTVLGLCSAYNHATNPALFMSEDEHKRSFAYARAIKARMDRLGFEYAKHYRELNDGQLWPLPSK